MHIWVDADACPKTIKEILYKAANRTKMNLTLVANHSLSVPGSIYIKTVQVSFGFDIADNYIVQHMAPGELVITADIPLADAVIAKGGVALNPRGELYSRDNIKLRLSMRNFSEQLRSTGKMTGGPPILSKKEIQQFANHLDQFLARHVSI